MTSHHCKDTAGMEAYDDMIGRIRQIEFPHMREHLYLDHAGTTLYSASLMRRFQAAMMCNLYGKLVH
jgi:molybdenum cofactor sulfurtransferase